MKTKLIIVFFIFAIFLSACGSKKVEKLEVSLSEDSYTLKDGKVKITGTYKGPKEPTVKIDEIEIKPDVSEGNFSIEYRPETELNDPQTITLEFEKDDDKVSKTVTVAPAIPLEIEKSYQAVGKTATITGKTSPNAEVSIGFGIINDSVTSDSSGNFSIECKVDDTEKTVDINVRKDSESNSKKTKIIPDLSITNSNSSDKEETDDITQLSDNPTSSQRQTLDSLAQMQFKNQYPYKGSKIKTIMGVLQNWTQQDGVWFYKAEAVIVNAYGAKRDATVEITIEPQSATSGIVSILDY